MAALPLLLVAAATPAAAQESAPPPTTDKIVDANAAKISADLERLLAPAS